VSLPLKDEGLFVFHTIGRKWSYWSLSRAILTGYAPLKNAIGAFKTLFGLQQPLQTSVLLRNDQQKAPSLSDHTVSVLIPTLNRYRFLKELLRQLRRQSVQPLEIIIVDQTPLRIRDEQLYEEFRDLPLRIFYMDPPGQCSARNQGLREASGDYVLFLDDDVEIPDNLIESHLQTIHQFQSSVSSGVAIERHSLLRHQPAPYVCCSDVFPTGNTLIRRSTLMDSGLFDLAYDRGDREDGDLGMRIYLSGAVMTLNHSIRVLHHRADNGGLRTFGVRTVTYGSSRSSLLHRRLPSRNEIYLSKRYFSDRQVREHLWITIAGTFSFRGSFLSKSIKTVLALVTLPHSIWTISRNLKQAREMSVKIPSFSVFHPDSSSKESKENQNL
jgi:glycosyltransferase involved in cell wall biosynthesis